MGRDTGFFRGENGLVLEMNLPLGDEFAGRLGRGELVRVADAEGTPWTEPEQAPPAAPAAGEAAELEATVEALTTELGETKDELELATKQRDALASELSEVKAALEKVTTERDEARAKATPPPAEPAAPARSTRATKAAGSKADKAE